MIKPEEDPLPQPDDIIQGLEQMLKGGGKLFSGSESTPLVPAQEPVIPSSGKDERFYMASFLINYFPRIPTSHPREGAKKLFDDFPSIRDGLIDDLKQSGKAQEIEVVRGITLNKLADFAKDQHENFARASGREEIGSPSLRDLRYKAEYWLRLEQISRSAADLERK